MTIKLYGHPFASYAWKPLIAAYERNVPFEFCMVDPAHAENSERIRELSPTGQFPALVDGERTVSQSNVVIEYLDRYGSAPTMIPDDADASLNARMLADVFDAYVAGPMQQIVSEALRPAGCQDLYRVAEAKASLDKSYNWLAEHISQSWAIGERFSIADCAAAPALFYADWVPPVPDGALKRYRAVASAAVGGSRRQ